LLGEVFEAGDVLVRLHFERVGNSRIPLALEVIEAERLADHIEAAGVAPGNELRMGVEVDGRYQRPVAYWVRSRHRSDLYAGRGASGSETVERVPADQIIHLRITERWPQTRGVPWLHSVLRKLDDLNEYSQHEITAARASAAYFASLKNPAEEGDLLADQLKSETDATGQSIMNIEALQVLDLPPGSELDFHAPNRPNSAFAEFTRSMLREIAAGSGASYESLSRDYSQSNYSSSRLALLDDRDNWRALQRWWVRSFREPLHRIWLRQAVLSRAVSAIPLDAYAADMARYEAVLFKPRGWSWVDPTKEVAAYKEAERAGYITKSQVIAQTAGGMDIEDYIAERRRELDMLEAADLRTDTEVTEAEVARQAQPAADTEDTTDASRLYRVRSA
jgi:lambda family phage portal protein